MGIRELKNSLSQYVRRVRGGEEVLVTDRGVVVAELRPPLPPGARPSGTAGLAALARRGILTLAETAGPASYPPLPPLLSPGSALKLLSEAREEGSGR